MFDGAAFGSLSCLIIYLRVYLGYSSIYRSISIGIGMVVALILVWFIGTNLVGLCLVLVVHRSIPI